MLWAFAAWILSTSPQFSSPVKTNPYSIKRYDSESFKIRPKKKHFEVPVVFLISPLVFSYGESVMEIVKHYKLGTIVGEPTAGCNGDVTYVSGAMMTFLATGKYVANRDGSTLYNVGIIPDIHITNSIQDIINGIDNQMNTAIKVLKKQRWKIKHPLDNEINYLALLIKYT